MPILFGDNSADEAMRTRMQRGQIARRTLDEQRQARIMQDRLARAQMSADDRRFFANLEQTGSLARERLSGDLAMSRENIAARMAESEASRAYGREMTTEAEKSRIAAENRANIRADEASKAQAARDEKVMAAERERSIRQETSSLASQIYNGRIAQWQNDQMNENYYPMPTFADAYAEAQMSLSGNYQQGAQQYASAANTAPAANQPTTPYEMLTGDKLPQGPTSSVLPNMQPIEGAGPAASQPVSQAAPQANAPMSQKDALRAQVDAASKNGTINPRVAQMLKMQIDIIRPGDMQSVRAVREQLMQAANASFGADMQAAAVASSKLAGLESDVMNNDAVADDASIQAAIEEAKALDESIRSGGSSDVAGFKSKIDSIEKMIRTAKKPANATNRDVALRTGNAVITPQDRGNEELKKAAADWLLHTSGVNNALRSAKEDTVEWLGSDDQRLIREMFPSVGELFTRRTGNVDGINAGYAANLWENVIRPMTEGDYSMFPEINSIQDSATKEYYAGIALEAMKKEFLKFVNTPPPASTDKSAPAEMKINETTAPRKTTAPRSKEIKPPVAKPGEKMSIQEIEGQSVSVSDKTINDQASKTDAKTLLGWMVNDTTGGKFDPYFWTVLKRKVSGGTDDAAMTAKGIATSLPIDSIYKVAMNNNIPEEIRTIFHDAYMYAAR